MLNVRILWQEYGIAMRFKLGEIIPSLFSLFIKKKKNAHHNLLEGL